MTFFIALTWKACNGQSKELGRGGMPFGNKLKIQSKLDENIPPPRHQVIRAKICSSPVASLNRIHLSNPAFPKAIT